MNRKEFLDELERLLSGIPDSEREEALQYYRDYFDDAGEENEASVIEELGSPEQVARTILDGVPENSAEYTENGYQDARFQKHEEMSSSFRKENTASRKKPDFWKILSIILLCILLSPILIALSLTLLGVLAGICVAAMGICVGLVASGFALLIAGASCIGYGIWKLFTFPALGLCLGGIGCLIFAVGILVSLLTLWCAIKLTPLLIRGIVKLIRYPFRKAGVIK